MLARPELKSIESLFARVFELVETRFDQLDLRQPAFGLLQQEIIIRLLKSTKIAATEERLFDAVLLWVKHKPKETQDRHLISLLPLVRCSTLNLDFFYERLKTDKLIHGHSALLKQLFAGPRNPRKGGGGAPSNCLVADDDASEKSERSERSEHSENTNASDVSKDDYDDYKAQKWSVL